MAEIALSIARTSTPQQAGSDRARNGNSRDNIDGVTPSRVDELKDSQGSNNTSTTSTAAKSYVPNGGANTSFFYPPSGSTSGSSPVNSLAAKNNNATGGQATSTGNTDGLTPSQVAAMQATKNNTLSTEQLAMLSKSLNEAKNDRSKYQGDPNPTRDQRVNEQITKAVTELKRSFTDNLNNLNKKIDAYYADKLNNAKDEDKPGIIKEKATVDKAAEELKKAVKSNDFKEFAGENRKSYENLYDALDDKNPFKKPLKIALDAGSFQGLDHTSGVFLRTLDQTNDNFSKFDSLKNNTDLTDKTKHTEFSDQVKDLMGNYDKGPITQDQVDQLKKTAFGTNEDGSLGTADNPGKGGFKGEDLRDQAQKVIDGVDIMKMTSPLNDRPLAEKVDTAIKGLYENNPDTEITPEMIKEEGGLQDIFIYNAFQQEQEKLPENERAKQNEDGEYIMPSLPTETATSQNEPETTEKALAKIDDISIGDGLDDPEDLVA